MVYYKNCWQYCGVYSFFIALLFIGETRTVSGYTMIIIVVVLSLLFMYLLNKYVSMQQSAIDMLKQYLQDNN